MNRHGSALAKNRQFLTEHEALRVHSCSRTALCGIFIRYKDLTTHLLETQNEHFIGSGQQPPSTCCCPLVESTLQQCGRMYLGIDKAVLGLLWLD
mmetsp:Transcript_16919/g.46457  ORF Transcript_16919/g.46457 Transcript_16919/m.46457 type:complete len:95 (+) Transcript_16919:1474-1758(+)